jgi:hypothetical protein
MKKVSKQLSKPTQRTFSYLTNKAAFIHKVVLSVDGALDETFQEKLIHAKNVGIFHPGVFYGRCVFGTWKLTGNPSTIHYGRTKKFPNVPPLRVTMRSESIPLTGAQTQLFVRGLAAGPHEIKVSSLELTFDLSFTNLSQVRRHLIHRAHREQILRDRLGRQTLYIGSPTSSWEARIYQKTESDLRLVFIFRRAFLSQHGINRPEDLLILRRLKIWRLLSVRRFSRSCAERVTQDWDNNVGRELIVTWAEAKRPLLGLVQILRNHQVDPNCVLRRTSIQRRLEAMQHRFVW